MRLKTKCVVCDLPTDLIQCFCEDIGVVNREPRCQTQYRIASVFSVEVRPFPCVAHLRVSDLRVHPSVSIDVWGSVSTYCSIEDKSLTRSGWHWAFRVEQAKQIPVLVFRYSLLGYFQFQEYASVFTHLIRAANDVVLAPSAPGDLDTIVLLCVHVRTNTAYFFCVVLAFGARSRLNNTLPYQGRSS